MTLTPLDKNLHKNQDDREVLVRVENVSKKFCRSLKKSLRYGVQDIASELFGRKYEHELRPDEFWAVKDVSFELRRGECLGLIGRNGAGKSTLLRMLNGLIKPDRGRIEINGQVGGLIALGAGFNPILTGRENIYVNGSILGLSKADIEARFEEIIEFAEIGEFIDAPVQTYSSGMNVRLGFAVAAVLIQPDVLLLDEVLAVGDMGFTIKCLNTMRQLVDRCAVIFVSHSMQFVSTFCSRVLVMTEGRSLLDTISIGQGIDKYLSLFPVEQSIAGTREATVESVLLKNLDTGEIGTHDVKIPQNSHLEIELEIITSIPGKVRIQIDTQGFVPILASTVVDENGSDLILNPGRHRVKFELGLIEFNAGQYSIVVGVMESTSNINLCRYQGAASFRVVANKVVWGYIVRQLIGTSELLGQ
jgi:lipopolysaccharide transport system ATP-binding protein